MSNLRGKPPLSTVGPDFRVPVGDPDSSEWDNITFETLAKVLGSSAAIGGQPYNHAVRVTGAQLGAGSLSDVVDSVAGGVVILGTGKLRILPEGLTDEAANYFVYDMGDRQSLIGAGNTPLLVKQADFTGIDDSDRGDFIVLIRG